MPSPRELLDQLGDQKYIALTTFRRVRSGEVEPAPVTTPVWMVRDGDRILVTTHSSLGKTKRIRHTPRVTVQACDARGRPRPGTEVFEGLAQVHDDAPSLATLTRLVRAKYGLQYGIVSRLARLRKSAGDEVALSIVLTSRS